MVFISAYVCLTIHNKSASLVWLPPWAQTSFWWCHYFKRYFLVAFCGLQPVIFALLSHTNTTSQQTRPQLFGGFLARIMRSRKNFHCYPFAVFPFLPAGRQQTRVQTGRTSPFVPDLAVLPFPVMYSWPQNRLVWILCSFRRSSRSSSAELVIPGTVKWCPKGSFNGTNIIFIYSDTIMHKDYLI